MLVSTKHLALMKFVPRTRRPPAEVKTLTEARQGASAGTIESLALADDFLQFGGQQAADRTTRLGGEDAGFPQECDIEFQSNVRFHDEHIFACSTILRA